MIVFASLAGIAAALGALDADGQTGVGGAPDHGSLHGGIGQPELLLRIHGSDNGADLIARIGQQLERR
jgi:hypothetical protein